MRKLKAVESDAFEARPGWALRGGSVAGLAIWLGVLLFLPSVPGVELRTYLSAAAMATLFAVLTAGHGAASVQVGPEGLRARTVFRRVRCSFADVHRIEVRRLLPGITYYLVFTRGGPVAFSSLWRRHRQLHSTLREASGLD